MQVNAIIDEVAQRITPTARPPEVERVISAIDAQLRKRKLRAKAHLGGSFAKDTWLVGDHDVDIFVQFDKQYADKDLSDILAPAIAFLKPTRVHGSRDYFQVDDHFTFEIIPVLAIGKDNQAKNITDWSIEHVSWVNKRSKKLKRDIRVAKKFCKAQRVYGAESYIRGFSGHVLDLLVIHHKGFLPLLRAATRWGAKTIIDIENTHKGKALLALNTSKTSGPLVLVDPVQPSRNAAASLTDEKYKRFIHAAKLFLAKPALTYFDRKEADFDALSRKGTLLRVRATPTHGSDDVVGTRLLKLYEHLHAALTRSGFTISNTSWEWDHKGDALLWFVTKEKMLPQTKKVVGPPARFTQHVANFKKVHKKTSVSKGHIVATVPTALRDPAAVIKAALRDPLVKEKTTRARLA